MSDNSVKKLLKEVQELRTQINEEIRKIQMFSDAYLLILLDLALMNDPCERLTKVLSAVSTDFPQPILEIYVKRSVSRAKEAKIEFEDFADCLTKGLGDRVRELRLVDEITRVYGIRAGERWKNIIESSNNPKKPIVHAK
jgi:hypothetical protein